MRAADALFGNHQLVACGCPLYRVTFDALLCRLGVWCVSTDGRLHRLSQMNSNGFFGSLVFQINSELRKMWPSDDRKWFIWYGKHGTTFQIFTLFSYASSSQSFQPECFPLASIIWFGFNLVQNCSWHHFFSLAIRARCARITPICIEIRRMEYSAQATLELRMHK